MSNFWKTSLLARTALLARLFLPLCLGEVRGGAPSAAVVAVDGGGGRWHVVVESHVVVRSVAWVVDMASWMDEACALKDGNM